MVKSQPTEAKIKAAKGKAKPVKEENVKLEKNKKAKRNMKFEKV